MERLYLQVFPVSYAYPGPCSTITYMYPLILWLAFLPALPISLPPLLPLPLSIIFPSSYVWGAVADAKGRRPIIVISCLMVGLCSAVYGFSINLAMAIAFRFGVGLMNGE